MKAVVTGATGYIGGRLCRALLDDGWDLVAIVMPGDTASLADGVARIEDPGDAPRLAEEFRLAAPDVVLHLAAVQHLSDDIAVSDALVDANLGFGARVLAAACASGARGLVAASSYSVHADGDENYAPQTLYAATKQAFVALSEHYRRNTPLSVTSLELSDTYGPGDTRPKFLNLLARTAATGTPLDASPGEQAIRPLHVDDVVGAFAHAAGRLARQDTLSATHTVAGPESVTLRELTAVFEAAVGVPVPVNWGVLPYRNREILRPWAGNPLPGWTPGIGLREGLASVYRDLSRWKGES